ncbi:unnamed protein product [Brassica napus]|uniref:(rape) hypothetical protein n=1 Tax=Brassica napus TaxID=3708 RepID=A0A816JMQ9_BRANA|nr:unnamed protein product [Brassica napus]
MLRLNLSVAFPGLIHVTLSLKVLEEIRVGLGLNEYEAQQKLYNYEHVDSSVIFETLYLTLSYGHGTSEQEVLDPPEDFFRVRMVVILLETCGHYFDRETKEEIGEEMYD